MTGADHLGYSFAPVPERAVQALGSRRLSADEFAILAVLYERASVRALCERRPCITITIARLAEAAGFAGEIHTFGRRFRRLRDKPERWFAYTVEGGHRYRFTLFPEPPELSEVCPRSKANQGAESSGDDPSTRPSMEVSGPRLDGSEDGSASAIEDDSDERPVRDPQRFQKTQTSLKRALGYDESRFVPEIREALRHKRERDLLAECEAIVAADQAAWVEDIDSEHDGEDDV